MKLIEQALFEPETLHARYNLEGALYDIKRLSEQGEPTDAVCIRTIERVCEQLAKAEGVLIAARAPSMASASLPASSPDHRT
jgi:hypothetical protein